MGAATASRSLDAQASRGRSVQGDTRSEGASAAPHLTARALGGLPGPGGTSSDAAHARNPELVAASRGDGSLEGKQSETGRRGAHRGPRPPTNPFVLRCRGTGKPPPSVPDNAGEVGRRCSRHTTRLGSHGDASHSISSYLVAVPPYWARPPTLRLR